MTRLLPAFLLMLLSIYCSTGTLSPTNLTTAPEINLIDSCGYIWNCDHAFHKAVFDFFDGTDPSGSILIRRPLFAVIGFPLMKVFGFELGGVMTSVLLHAAAFWFFCLTVARTLGSAPALAVAWLLSTYPGVSYWAGMPYTYMMIVPGSLAIGAVMLRMRQDDGIAKTLLAAFFIGLIFLGYDFYAIFLPAVSLLVLRRSRSPVRVLVTALGMTAPIVAWLAYLVLRDIPLGNSNTEVYSSIVNGYAEAFRTLHVAGLIERATQLPRVFFLNAIYSNFCALPIGALLILAWLRVSDRRGIPRFFASPTGPVFASILLSTLALLVFINLNPVETVATRWDVRGTWISRLYLPSFIAYLVLFAYAFGETAVSVRLRVARSLIVAAVVAFNSLIAFGPILGDPFGVSSTWYANFYTMGPTEPPTPASVTENLERVGRRPLGFCVDSAALGGAREGRE